MEISPKLVILCVCFLAVLVSGEPAAVYNQFVPQTCLKCLCFASSGCNKDVKCHGPVCGPFRISLPYWLDAGSPKVDDDDDDDDDIDDSDDDIDTNEVDTYSDKPYRECANNFKCASRAVVAYMKRYAKDCDGDGIINCDDFARIHRNGPGACSSPLDDTFKEDYEYCMEEE